VLLVGASSGIGRSIAQLLAAEGARVAVAGRRVDRLQELVAETGSVARHVLALPLSEEAVPDSTITPFFAHE
jgi:NADP-dependent 3-hydroxy acid dehydrogenase YdfG